MNRWRAADKELPPNAIPVLAWDVSDDEVHGPIVANWYFLSRRWVSTETGKALRVSHWLAITEPHEPEPDPEMAAARAIQTMVNDYYDLALSPGEEPWMQNAGAALRELGRRLLVKEGARDGHHRCDGLGNGG